MKRDKENWVVADVEGGDYIVMMRTPWISIVNQCSFSIYGPKKSKIKLLNI